MESEETKPLIDPRGRTRSSYSPAPPSSLRRHSLEAPWAGGRPSSRAILVNSRGTGSINNLPPDSDGADELTSSGRSWAPLGPIRHDHLALSDQDVRVCLTPTFPSDFKGKQGSLVTVFSIWNTMMGTSLLSIPWAIGQAGFVLAIVLILLMAGVTLYTAYLIMKSGDSLGAQRGIVVEFSDVCRLHLGRAGEYVSIAFSIVALLGGAIVYWVLMSNFMFTTVTFIFDKANDIPEGGNSSWPHSDSYGYLQCSVDDSHDDTANATQAVKTFDQFWDLTDTVPFYLLILLVPLINFKSPTFFTKFTALGTVSVAYLFGFVTYRGAVWGVNLDFDVVPYARTSFPILTGTLSLAYFIHTCILSIVRNQQKPKNNGRDLVLGYVCVCFTYLYLGVVFYSTWSFNGKDCIQDNLLNNFSTSDPLALVGCIFIFFQLLTLYPLLLYILRLQFMHTVFGNVWPSLKHILVFNALCVAVCLLFAKFLPNIGVIIRYTGALSGFVYTFTLPCVVYMLEQRIKGTLTGVKVIVHSVIILLGLLNLIAQFIV